MCWILKFTFSFFLLKMCYLTVPSCSDGWTLHSKCSVTCGTGLKVSYRKWGTNSTCLSAHPERDVRNFFKVENCTMPGCHGGWSNWESFGSCSVTCGTGNRTFIRHCNNPVPRNGGHYCEGENVKYEGCNTGGCPGNWGCWQAVGRCSATCGNGTHLRVRECDNPAPTDRGRTCEGYNVSNDWCNIRDCPVFKWGFLKEMNLTKSEILAAMKEELNELQAYLTVDTRNTSAAIRLRTSARDERPSAASVGYVAIVLLSIPCIMMICCDCTRLFQTNGKEDNVKGCGGK